MTPIVFPYKLNSLRPIGIILGSCLFGAIMGYEALSNENGIIIKGVHLSHEVATIFFWIIAVYMGLIAIIGLFLLVIATTNEKTLSLSEIELSIPKRGLSKQKNVVRLDEIQGLTVQTILKEKLLLVYYPQGKVSISCSMLPSPEIFENLCQTIS